MGNYVGLVSLSDHSTKLTGVRNMLLDGHIFCCCCFQGGGVGKTINTLILPVHVHEELSKKKVVTVGFGGFFATVLNIFGSESCRSVFLQALGDI